MADAKGIRAGRAFVELFADGSKLVRGLRAAERKLKAFEMQTENTSRSYARISRVTSLPTTKHWRITHSIANRISAYGR